MDYKLIKATKEDINILIKYKLETIFEYDKNINNKNNIINYVKINIPKYLKDYKMIKVNNNICGCLLLRDYEDGKLLDEIYIENLYRNKGIGSDIINNIIKINKPIYLWVYKNNIAINLYKKYDFKIIEEVDNRYLMKRG